jgi:predicted peroxiredoxin
MENGGPRRLLVGCSHGAEDALRVTAAYLAAVAGAEEGRETALWLTSDGVRLATEGYVEGIRAAPGAPAVQDLHDQLTRAHGRLFVCPVSLQALMLGDEPLVEAAEVAKARRVLDWAGLSALTISF